MMSASRNGRGPAIGIPSALMYGSLVDQDINCRTIGRCAYGDAIDREPLDMVPRDLGAFAPS